MLDTSTSNPGVFATALSPIAGQSYVLAGKLDFDSDQLMLWINPEADSEARPTLTVAFDGDDWSSGIMLGSSSDGSGARWDNLEVASEFADLTFPIVTPPFELPELTISEFMASDTQTIDDADGESSDWIEVSERDRQRRWIWRAGT